MIPFFSISREQSALLRRHTRELFRRADDMPPRFPMHTREDFEAFNDADAETFDHLVSFVH